MKNIFFFLPIIFAANVFFTTSAFATIVGSNNATCTDTEILCGSNLSPACSEPEYKPACSNNLPTCCNKSFSPIVCDSSLFSCQFTTVIKPTTNLDVEILASPKLPDIVMLSNEADEFSMIRSTAYVGSSPSFEVSLKTAENDIKIISVDLDDSAGSSFKDIPFSVLDILDAPKIKVLSVTLPDDISVGGLTYKLNLASGNNLSGLIDVIDFFNVEIPNKNRNILKPTISKVKLRKKKKKVIIDVYGQNFVRGEILFQKNGQEVFEQGLKDSINTTVTIFPNSLNGNVHGVLVSNDRRSLKVKFSLLEKLQSDINAILVVATPRGITSHPFTIKK